MSPMDASTLVEAILASDKMEDLQNYLSRGRRFQPLEDTSLKERWTSAFQAMAEQMCEPSGHHSRLTEVIDLQSELDLRGIAAPMERVAAAMKTITAHIDRDLSNPRFKKRLREQISELLIKSRH